MIKPLRARGKPQMERVLTPSLSIIYPLTQKISKKVFFCSFHPFLCWIKEKSVATLSIRTIAIKRKHPSQFSHRVTELATLLGNIT